MSEVQISPLAKRLAEENSIDWRKIRGTGPEGRVIERDILTYLARIMSGEADLPAEPDKSEPAGPSSMPAAVAGNVANFAAASAGLAKEGVDLSALIGGMSPPTIESAPLPPLDFGSLEPSPPVQAIGIPEPIPPIELPAVALPPVAELLTTDNEPVFEIDFDDLADDEVAIVFENPVIPSTSSVVEMVTDTLEPAAPAWTAPVVPEPAWTAPVVPEPVISEPAWSTAAVVETQAPIWTAPIPEAPVWTAPVPEAPVWTAPIPEVIAPVQPVWAMPEPVAIVPEPFVPATPVFVAPPEPVYVAPAYVAPEPVYVAPEPVYVAPEPVYVAPEPVYVPPAYLPPEPVFVAPPAPEPVYVPPVYVAPEPVYVAPEPVYVPPVYVAPEPVYVPPIPEPVYVAPVYVAPEPVYIAPIIAPIPEVIATAPTSFSTPSSGVVNDFFQLFVARREINTKPLEEIRTQLSASLNNREIANELFLARAVGRALHLLGLEQFTFARLEASGLQGYQVIGLQHSFLEALQGFSRATPCQSNGLMVVDASRLGVDDLVLPSASGVLALGRNGKLTLAGNLPPLQSTEFLQKVAELLENPVGLVV